MIYQIALIPGSLITGFLLSPLLYLSRHIARQPVRRLRYPEQRQLYRRLLAAGFYLGALLIITGLIGLWTRWCLGNRDPWVWVVFWLLEGKRQWSRIALLAYWSVLVGISVAGWNRQLARSRRYRHKAVMGTANTAGESVAVDPANRANGYSSGGGGGGSGPSSLPAAVAAGPGNQSDSSTATPTLPPVPQPAQPQPYAMSAFLPDTSTPYRLTFPDLNFPELNFPELNFPDLRNLPNGTQVATDWLDAADKRVPTLSVNARRKYFHALAVVMFLPGVAVDVSTLSSVLGPFNPTPSLHLHSLGDRCINPNPHLKSSLSHVTILTCTWTLTTQPAFTHLSFSAAFALFTFTEYVRYFALYPFGAAVHVFMHEFLDGKDSGTAILSHFYLLTGCANSVWFEGCVLPVFIVLAWLWGLLMARNSPSLLLQYTGILALGVGDALVCLIYCYKLATRL